MDWRLLIETSHRRGLVALARNDTIAEEIELNDARRHAKDLTLSVKALLQSQGISSGDLSAVVVGLGPGSYTGLRVGLTSAKTLAYAMEIPLSAVPTFHAIAEDLPGDIVEADIVADALQGRVFHQRFRRDLNWQPLSSTSIIPISDLKSCGTVTGPAAMMIEAEKQIVILRPSASAILKTGSEIKVLCREEMFAIEPIYLQGSSAEEKRRQSAKAVNASERVS